MNLAPAETLLGALLAAANGVEATAVAESARRTLTTRGYPLVEASGRLTLACATQHFDPCRFAAAQRGRFGAALEVWETLGSTNARAWEAGAAAAGTVVVAEQQSSGRGRHGRRWDCPAHGGLLFSLLLPPGRAPSARPQLLPLALAVGAADALRQATGLDVRLKWPNDLVVLGAAARPRKVGGILLEARAGSVPGVVVGCGLNVQVPREFFAAHGLDAAASLAAADAPRREVLLADILAAMERRFQEWEASQWSSVLRAWEGLDVLRGQDVELECGAERWRGLARGITPLGLLELELPDGHQRRFAAGEVHVR